MSSVNTPKIRVSYFLTTSKNTQEVQRQTWRTFSLAVAREEEFSLAVVEQARTWVFWGAGLEEQYL